MPQQKRTLSPPLAKITCSAPLALDLAHASKRRACPTIVGVCSDPLLKQFPVRGRVG